MAKSRTRDRTPKKGDWKPAFIQDLARRGNVSLAAAAVKIGRRTAYDTRDVDEAFRLAWDEAVDIATALMEEEGRRRAADGTLRPVFQGGKLVGKVREYSDTLLIFFLKARKPDVYRDRQSIEHSGSVVQTHVYLPPKHDPPA